MCVGLGDVVVMGGQVDGRPAAPGATGWCVGLFASAFRVVRCSKVDK